MEKFVIIDGNSLINRAFYGLPPLSSLSGRQCGAVYGFINMMMSVITNEKPKYLVCVFDAGKHTFRHDMYADYKGTRQGMPEDLHEQLILLQDLLRTMGIQIIQIPEIEADDIVGSLTKKFNEEFIIISGDKDLLQLIDKNVTVWLTQKGISNVLKVDEKVLKEEFNLAPYQVVELKAIMGDTSDNIPGVGRIGKIGAMKLIEEYGDLDNVYNNLDSIKDTTRVKLERDKERAYLSKQLATIKLDVPIECDLKSCEYKIPFSTETVEIMTELGFKSILNRKEYFVKPTVVAQETNIEANFVEIDSNESLADMLNSLGDVFALNMDELCLYIAREGVEYIIYTSGEIFNKNLDKFRDLMSGQKQKVCFDAKAIMHALSDFEIELNNYFDVSIAIYTANEMDAEIKLEDALKLNNIITKSKTLAIIKLKEIYINKLINSCLLKLYSEIELPLVRVLFEMEHAGIKIDVEAIKNLSVTYHDELTEIESEIYRIAGEEFNINSPKQLQSILFEKLGIEYNKKISTSIEVLNEIVDKHEIVPYVIRYRKIAKLISTYIDGMLNLVRADGKIHTTFMQRLTSTGRLSSREPNLQNLPIRDDEGRTLRKMFASSFDDGCIVSADYNQIELRLMANFSEDENMIADYNNGLDIHTATASKIFNVGLDMVTPSMRRVAKSVNFGIIYGISAYGLAQNIHTSPKEAGEFIKKYMEIYPKVKLYGEKCVALAREHGYATTLMGRIRHIPDINSKNFTVRGFAERTAKNMPLQGSASDIIKIAMIKVYNRFKEAKLKSKLVIQIHDELVVDCLKEECETVKQILKEEMESVVDLQVPLIVNVAMGKTLYDAKS